MLFTAELRVIAQNASPNTTSHFLHANSTTVQLKDGPNSAMQSAQQSWHASKPPKQKRNYKVVCQWLKHSHFTSQTR